MKISLLTETKNEIIRRDIADSKIQILPDNCYVYQTVNKETLLSSIKKECVSCRLPSCEYREADNEAIDISIAKRINRLENAQDYLGKEFESCHRRLNLILILNTALLIVGAIALVATIWL